MKLKKILVPTDFSDEAKNALEVAAALARKAEAEITLLHVIDVPVVGHYDSLDIMHENDTGDDVNIHRAYMLKLMDMTKGHIKEAKDQYNDIKISEHVVFDSLDKHLFEFVIKDKTDLIVIGSKGSSGVAEVLVGSNTEKVIRSAKAPVLTVKHKEENFEAKNIVFASDFLEVPATVIDSIKTIQKLYDSKLNLVKVVTPNSFTTTPDIHAAIQKFVNDNNIENYTLNAFNSYSEEEGIRAFANTINADLLMMSTHGRTGIAHLILGSIAESVANHSIRPVLTFNQHFQK